MPAHQRLDALAGHLTSAASNTPAPPSPGLKKILEKKEDDIVITYATRTPLTKARKGGLKDTPTEELLIHILRAVREKSGIDPNVVEDVCVGNVLTPGPGFHARSAVLAAGFPVSTAASVASRFCSSGLLAIQTIAGAIALGAIQVGIAVGCESMSSHQDIPPVLSDAITSHPVARDNLQPMGWTSENVARDFHVSREAQDRYAEMSHTRAERARSQGWSADEITPVTTRWVDPQTGEARTITVDQDDGIRPGTTYDRLSTIRPAFPHWGPTTTGGNASQVTDGAAAVLLMKRSTAEKLGQPIMAKYVTSTVVGLEPRIMGIGPSLAIPKVLGLTGLTREDVDLWEINEAFASMYVYCVEKLGLDVNKVNVRGGAIAIGHPLGCTGTRQVVTVLSELRRRKARVAVTSMCVGTGMGMAGVFVSEV
ncbi:acetyl-CoA acyltransferase [Capronia epimyces CBS 606.96]|uniref:acetyl-CoA C-acyltransferase n=1 Tax=Capronia epimyces CBS 606.96 TaxID=1182542 RepID=W9YFY7_9EURO|nr:acetyl-CoA acyltransferase [Capronia epimyces CBS 606.96]EXJ81209.1 acetyl-CoA acyltransferase [Capronia epimyces CBS 606.96]